MFGFGYGEILVILCLIVLFFGSKELPSFIRQLARLFTLARRYSERVRRELDEISRPEPLIDVKQTPGYKKGELRKRYSAAREALSEAERVDKSTAIVDRLASTPQFSAARAIMLYASIGPEVATHDLIRRLLAEGKRVLLPYCRAPANDLGIGAIDDFDRDCTKGEFGIPEPVAGKRDNFFKSDVQLIVCPGVAFDRSGGRLGHGKMYYDRFLSEARGRIPIFGLAYECQIMDESLPFEYHDVAMDQIITENGPVIKRDG